MGDGNEGKYMGVAGGGWMLGLGGLRAASSGEGSVACFGGGLTDVRYVKAYFLLLFESWSC